MSTQWRIFPVLPKHGHKIIVAILLIGMGLSQVAANVHSMGNITVHYHAFNSASIPAEVANAYKIRRGGRTGVVNITVMKNDKPVIANIFGNGKNLAGQLKALSFKEIREGAVIYYIATFTFNHSERLTFDLQVQPEREGKLIPITFKQEMFIN